MTKTPEKQLDAHFVVISENGVSELDYFRARARASNPVSLNPCARSFKGEGSSQRYRPITCIFIIGCSVKWARAYKWMISQRGASSLKTYEHLSGSKKKRGIILQTLCFKDIE